MSDKLSVQLGLGDAQLMMVDYCLNISCYFLAIYPSINFLLLTLFSCSSFVVVISFILSYLYVCVHWQFIVFCSATQHSPSLTRQAFGRVRFVAFLFEKAFIWFVHQAFSDYQLQQMTSNFIDQFGFNEEDFAEQEEKIE